MTRTDPLGIGRSALVDPSGGIRGRLGSEAGVLAGDIDAATALPVLEKTLGTLAPKALEAPAAGESLIAGASSLARVRVVDDQGAPMAPAQLARLTMFASTGDALAAQLGVDLLRPVDAEVRRMDAVDLDQQFLVA